MNIGLGSKRKTILLVDADPHARAVLRNALEAAGFTVGEAATAREGERTVIRVKPDAILADLMMETIDAGGAMADKLKESAARSRSISSARPATPWSERSACTSSA